MQLINCYAQLLTTCKKIKYLKIYNLYEVLFYHKISREIGIRVRNYERMGALQCMLLGLAKLKQLLLKKKQKL